MTIDIHSLLEKNPITKKHVKTKIWIQVFRSI